MRMPLVSPGENGALCPGDPRDVEHFRGDFGVNVANQGSAEERHTGCRSAAGCLALVALGQAQGRGHGGQEEGGTGHDHCASRPEHLPTVQGLDRPEGPHHPLPVLEFELRERPELEEQTINTRVMLQDLERAYQGHTNNINSIKRAT
ncbi:hypothetical protein EYF80_024739 [Liparis tanakae]|uniref:Uncharacterized protein n=1 Tax=Liparis tanakae TaxID=230148 RepID=A0A4Z2HHJ0_9TELE|nr:hypothetical protein EYF80_024739 [Liparis tanakae]